MTLQRIAPTDIETFTLRTSPQRTFISNSSGVSGSVYVYPRRSATERDIVLNGDITSSLYADSTLEDTRKAVVMLSGTTDISAGVEQYLSAANAHPESVRKQTSVNVNHFTPPFSFNSNFLRKSLVRTHLMPYYRTDYPQANYSFSNYHSLNFFTQTNTTYVSSALLYPNPVLDDGLGSTYQVSGAFTFDFFVKPSHVSGAVDPMCVMHLTGAYRVTIHSGSETDDFGACTSYRAVLQLGEDAGTDPDDLGSYLGSSMLTMATSDNTLPVNEWTHVTFTWGGETYSDGSGSIYVNSNLDNQFCISSPVWVGHYTGSWDPSVLIIGANYAWDNESSGSIDRWFAADPALRDGLVELNGTPGIEEPLLWEFTNPMKGELHDLRMLSRYMSQAEVESLGQFGPTSLTDYTFYLGPYFTVESPFRQAVTGFGGELVSPFFEKNASSTTPFAAQMAFSNGGHYINLENYTRDLVTGNYPRLLGLSGSVVTPPSTTVSSSNWFLYEDTIAPQVVRRNYAILPCDDGSYTPNFGLLSALSQSRAVNDLGNSEPGAVSILDIVDDSFVSRAIKTTGSILNDVLGSRPDDITALPGNSLAVLHRTHDTSSNQVVIFDISNLFYGLQIKPGTLVLSTSQLGYTDDLKMTLRDNGRGSLYRADASSGPYPVWASVGNVFYNEGIIIIKYPQLFFFDQNDFYVEFEGQQNVHVTSIRATAKSGLVTHSDNSSFNSASSLFPPAANQPDDTLVQVSTVLVHDDNLNVIMRGKLAQPVVKRSGDKISFVLKMDW